MMGMASKYDTYDRTGSKVFVGEWASHDGPAPWESGPRSGPTPNLMCAVADAAFMTGLERNSDVVTMACYAPLLVNVNPGGRQWSINMIGYDCLTSYGSPSYYAQKMFAANLGDRTVPISLSNVPVQSQGNRTLPSLFVSATRDSKKHLVYVKIVNALSTSQEVTITTQGGTVGTDGTKAVLKGDPKAMNTLEEPSKVVPVSTSVHEFGGSFRQTLEPYSITVLTLRSSK
jgi:alpha-N-arabinofuranosidase